MYYWHSPYFVLLWPTSVALPNPWWNTAVVFNGNFFLLYRLYGARELRTNSPPRGCRKEWLNCCRHKHNIANSSIFVCYHTSICYCRKVTLSNIFYASRSLFINFRRACGKSFVSTCRGTHEQE